MTLQFHSWTCMQKKQTQKHGLKIHMHPNVHCSTVYNS